jgi:thiamine biosynthesis protein ThiC
MPETPTFSTVPQNRVIVSRTGTRHISTGGSRMLCQFTIREHEALPLSEATRDCQFCLREWKHKVIPQAEIDRAVREPKQREEADY